MEDNECHVENVCFNFFYIFFFTAEHKFKHIQANMYLKNVRNQDKNSNPRTTVITMSVN